MAINEKLFAYQQEDAKLFDIEKKLKALDEEENAKKEAERKQEELEMPIIKEAVIEEKVVDLPAFKKEETDIVKPIIETPMIEEVKNNFSNIEDAIKQIENNSACGKRQQY